MQIEILSVAVNDMGKYKEANVSYKDRDGKSQGKKIVSFKFPEVFSAVVDAKPGNIFEVKPVKEGNFWNWAEAVKVEGGPKAATLENVKATPRSTYETPEERAARQVFIIRQSGLSNAIEYFKLTEHKKAKPADVLALAQTFEDFVFNRVESTKEKKDAISALKEMENDIPL